jgi:Protein of unknown function (DUF3602)
MRQTISTGRGGAGNIRSPSRDAAHALSAEEAAFEKDVLKRRAEAEKTAVVSPSYQSACFGFLLTAGSTRLVVGVLVTYPVPVLGDRVRYLCLLLSIRRVGEVRVISWPAMLPPPVLWTNRSASSMRMLKECKQSYFLRKDYASLIVLPWYHHSHSTGRGGAGNLTESAIPGIELHSHHATGPESTGRGGAGNIRNLQSRPPGSVAMHSTGRGGAGNVVVGNAAATDNLDYEERKQHHHAEGM